MAKKKFKKKKLSTREMFQKKIFNLIKNITEDNFYQKKKIINKNLFPEAYFCRKGILAKKILTKILKRPKAKMKLFSNLIKILLYLVFLITFHTFSSNYKDIMTL